MVIMAAAPSTGGATSNVVSDEERRWVVIGVCLTKVLTPALRKVLSNEIPKWYRILVNPPYEIHKQTYAKHSKSIAPSTLKLNYESINNNSVHRTPKAYDYTVKDPLSLAKLFMKPFMANFTGFDQSMDTSAVLSIMCEAQPFISSGADVIAKKVRSDVRNEWAHCNFAHWTDVHYSSAIQTMQFLAKKARMTPADEENLVDELESWKSDGFELCFSHVVNPKLLKLVQDEVAELMESVQISKEEMEAGQQILLKNLQAINESLKQEIASLAKKNELTQMVVQKMDRKLTSQYTELVLKQSSIHKDVELLRLQLSKSNLETDEDIAGVYLAPNANSWFSGRENEIEKLQHLLESQGNDKVSLAAITGLGGTGKTSLVVEYAQRRKDHYKGGVFWFSAEDDTKLENSVNDVALCIGSFQHGSFGTTLSRTLVRISQIRKPWLMVVDAMDGLLPSQDVTKLVVGSWQRDVSGHIVITSRRKPMSLVNGIRAFTQSYCLELGCFEHEEAKKFLFHRAGVTCDEQTDAASHDLVQELGGLPLALEQAGAYISSLGCTISTYLEAYKAQRLALLSQQQASRVSEYESDERLAVHTTWSLNFEHLQGNLYGVNAIPFVNACAFLSPSEIYRELINVGKPVVEDERFRECIVTALGCHQVLKLLTDLSLFQESQSGCLCVHRLVQEVVRDNLTEDERAESFVNAVRFLNYALAKCASPHELLSDIANERQHTVSLNPPNPSLYFKWSKLCLHCHELRRHLEHFVNNLFDRSEKTVFSLETVAIVYECAVNLSVNGRNDEAIQTVNLAHRLLDWTFLGGKEDPFEKFEEIFLHFLPLPHSVAKFIQYSCRAPDVAGAPCAVNVDPDASYSKNEETDDEVNKFRQEGNRLFKENQFEEAVKIYSHAINISKENSSFDYTLLTNRASAYLKLEQFENALKDASDYVEHRSDCWKGYARQALAFNGLNNDGDAVCAAALAFYWDRRVCRVYKPFREVFSNLEQRISICRGTAELLDFLPDVLERDLHDFVPNQAKKILLLVPGCYTLSPSERKLFFAESGSSYLLLSGCMLIGVRSSGEYRGRRVTLEFRGNCGVQFVKTCVIGHIDFIVDESVLNARRNSNLKVFNCSFTKVRDSGSTSFSSLGTLEAKSCRFVNSCSDGLFIRGCAKVQDCVFSGNERCGVMVREGGKLVVEGSVFHSNSQGVVMIAEAQCSLVRCQIQENRKEGVFVMSCSGDITLCNNRISNNGLFGISLVSGSASIERNEIFENGLWGIKADDKSSCHVSHNKVYRNKMGGVCVEPQDSRQALQVSCVQFNEIFDNYGPGIGHVTTLYDPEKDSFKSWHGNKVECMDNKLYNNREAGQNTVVTRLTEMCSYCRKVCQLKKCTGCFSTEYCAPSCQRKHWSSHKKTCKFLLSQSSVLTDPRTRRFPNETEEKSDQTFSHVFQHNPGLDPVGPMFSEPPPRDGKRFIVKVEAAEYIYGSNDISVHVYDRSQNVLGYFDSRRLYHLIRQCGFNCQRQFVEKKLFLWASLKDGHLRIFTNELAPYQKW